MQDILLVCPKLLANTIIHVGIFWVAVLNNCEMGHVDGTVKVTSRKEVAAEQKYLNAADMIDCLQDKFGDNELFIISGLG